MNWNALHALVPFAFSIALFGSLALADQGLSRSGERPGSVLGLQGPQPPMGTAAAKHFERRRHEPETGSALTYYLMKPANHDPDKQYPLVLCLHGRGGSSRAATVLGSDTRRRQYPAFVVAPVSGRDRVWATARDTGDEHALPLVLEVVEGLREEFKSIDSSRIYVTGQSMGGTGSFGAIAARPDLFAAAVPVCGGWSPADARKMAGVPVWAFHGLEDQRVPPERSREMIAALDKVGAKTRHTEYEGVGHNSWNRAYADAELWKWLFAQRRSSG